MGVDEQAQPAEPAGHGRQIERGQRVYSADGHHLGAVDEVHGSYFVAAKGLFFPRDRYVPHSAIDHIDEHGIHLAHRQQEIEALGWETFPEETPARAEAATMPTGEGETWEAVRAQHEALWQATRTDERERWAEVEPLYRYGWELAHNRRYRYLLWSEIEPSAQRDWEAQHPDRLWAAVAPSVKRAWEFTSGTGDTPSGAAVADTEEGRALQVQAQQLQIDKEMVAVGNVEVRKEIITELRTIEVPVTREELVITKHPREGGEDGEEAETIRIPLREEKIVVQKAPLAEQGSGGEAPAGADGGTADRVAPPAPSASAARAADSQDATP